MVYRLFIFEILPQLIFLEIDYICKLKIFNSEFNLKLYYWRWKRII